ncbi:MAG: MFS transporter [Litoreibacter sp.]|nr:MFS transporter [Litoreibacter sp.]
MAFQFQSVAALSPLIARDYGASLADIGLLIGFYLAPGVIIAIPGGAIAAWFGDKRVVAFSMVLMLAGGLLLSLASSWEMQVAGRLLAGVGGVVINIVMTKMVVDWFVGREIATAMGIFVTSWPVGIALALLVLPILGEAGGLALARFAVVGLVAVGLILFMLFYRTPEGATPAQAGFKIGKFPGRALFMAGIIWALYNSALAMIFSFGPAILSMRGWEITAASSLISAFMVVFSVTLPLGGILVDRTGRRDTAISVSFLSFVVLLPLIFYVPDWAVWAIFLIVGALFSLAAGPVMTLPSEVLAPEDRAFGMGIFYSIYYGAMMAAPSFAGDMAERYANAGVAILLGAMMLVICIIALVLFRRSSPVTAAARA